MKKKLLLSIAGAALLLVAPQPAKSADVSVDFFYNNLSGGSWIDVGDYGYCWQPDVAVNNQTWRPYADGYWAYTDLGWTWVSYEDFGWATYHYGRWARLTDYGWVWVPGRDQDLEWGPAWVSWRTGGEYIGWAPLPPETIAVVEGRPLSGHLDVEFNIGPSCYNFVDVRYIGEPVLRERIVSSTQNVTYIQQTVNVTNITYKNKSVYNYGPDLDVINRSATRPIQRLRLDRQENVDVSAAARSGGLTKVQGDTLVVAAPMRIARSGRQVAPPAVKTKVEKANIDHGWAVAGDEKAQTALKQQIKTQDLKKVPPTTSAATGQGNVNAGASASPGVEAAGGAGAAASTSTQAGKGKQGRRGENAMTAGSPAVGVSPTETASPAAGASQTMTGKGEGRGKNRYQPMEQNAATGGVSPAQASPGAAASTESSSDVRAGQGRGRGGRAAEQNAPTATSGSETTAPGASNQSSAAGDESQAGGAHNRRNHVQPSNAEGQGAATATGAGAPSGDQGQGGRGRHVEGQGNAGAENTPVNAQGGSGKRGAQQREEAAGEKPKGQGQGRQGAKKGEASPAPSPQ